MHYWNKLCTPVEFGGLGIHRILEINAALLCKWVWNFSIQDGKLWKRLIGEKYGLSEGGWYTKKVLSTYGCSLWRGIVSTEHIIKTNGKLWLGNGNRISFWGDCWCGNVSFASRFPRLFTLSTRPRGTVAAHRITSGMNTEWDLHFRRSLLDREIEELAELLQALEQVTLVADEVDRMIWQDGSVDFGPKTVYKYLESIRMDGEQTRCVGFPAKRVWLKEVPSKVDFFVWALYRGRTLTSDNLRKRGKPMPLRCIMCGKEEESIPHLFLNCDTARWVWNKLLSGFGIQLVGNTDLESWFRGRVTGRRSRVGDLIWLVIFHAVTWCLWLERNQRIFEDKANNLGKILQNVINCIWGWIKFDPLVRGLRVEDLMFNWAAVISPGG